MLMEDRGHFDVDSLWRIARVIGVIGNDGNNLT